MKYATFHKQPEETEHLNFMGLDVDSDVRIMGSWNPWWETISFGASCVYNILKLLKRPEHGPIRRKKFLGAF